MLLGLMGTGMFVKNNKIFPEKQSGEECGVVQAVANTQACGPTQENQNLRTGFNVQVHLSEGRELMSRFERVILSFR